MRARSDAASAATVARAHLPSRFGDFQVVAFQDPRDGKEHVALVRGNVEGRRDLPVRVHSECLTGDVFGSLRCDCREQLERSLRDIGSLDRGIILYLRQEGRGIGLLNKIRAYGLQEQGLDTMEANQALGFHADERDYRVAADMLRALGVRSIRLISNNPAKLSGLQAHGIQVSDRIPIIVPPNPHNRFYLETKRMKAGHFLRPERPTGPLTPPPSVPTAP